MRINSCHIENFGKLQNADFTFRPGCNVICQANGWGKSTLTAFIRVMFYGFEEEKARDELRNERRRYRPWQGGVYGGRLEFEAAGETYVITRTFGAREKDDTFELRVKATNLESSAFSERVGEELFQIDSASFCRTVFLTQNDCETTATDSVNAKMGNLAREAGDINDFEAASQRLTDQINSMNPGRKTGSLYQMKNELARLRESVRAARTLGGAMEEVRGRIREREQEQERLKAQREELTEKQRMLGAYRDRQSKWERYQVLCQALGERREQVRQAGECFPKQPPSREELDRITEVCGRLPAACQSLEFYRLTREEQKEALRFGQVFADGIPGKEEIQDRESDLCQAQALRYDMAREQLSLQEAEKLGVYRRRFARGVPSPRQVEERLNCCRQAQERERLLAEKRASLEAAAAGEGDLQEGRGALSRLLILPGLMLAAGGVLLLALSQGGILGPLLILGGLLWCGGVLLRSGQRKRALAEERAERLARREALEAEIAGEEEEISRIWQETEDYLAGFGLASQGDVQESFFVLKDQVREYLELCRRQEEYEQKDLEGRSGRLTQQVQNFLGTYGLGQDGRDLSGALRQLQAMGEEYLRLQKKEAQFGRARESCEALWQEAEGFFDSLGLEAPPREPEKLQGRLAELQRQLQTLHACYREYREARRQKEEFEQRENMEELGRLQPGENSEGLEELGERLKEISDRLGSSYEYMADERRQLEELGRESDAAAEVEEELAALTQAYERGRERYELLQKTREYLSQAKSSLTARYTEPVRRAFDKYYRMLAGEDGARFYVDADTRLTVDEQGMQRDPRFLSAGRRDLIGVCMRMALVDAMYRGEKPFLILDDPFANLDGEKLKGAMELLRQIAGEYQVLYFTCHESRTEAARAVAGISGKEAGAAMRPREQGEI